MPKESLEYLEAGDGGDFLDCTFGGGGHAKRILEANPVNKVIALDCDLNAIERAESFKSSFKERFELFHSNFSEIENLLAGKKFKGILADLGISTDQLTEDRGFSFQENSDLDMRMNQSESLSANQVINEYPENELFKVLKVGGVGKEARKIVKGIVKERPIEDIQQLVSVIRRNTIQSELHKKRNPATTIFQAIRIEVNQEFASIKKFLKVIPRFIEKKSRLVVISFHSLEDKLITSAMRESEVPSLGKLLTKKAIRPSVEEVNSNPASRSALLRVFEFC
ncbi:UNVERIFIED_CONTAM: hypothetical protein GTU68_052477 [Idotea baltica]|nr:hypothetical protein [Idotea baltica]